MTQRVKLRAEVAEKLPAREADTALIIALSQRLNTLEQAIRNAINDLERMERRIAWVEHVRVRLALDGLRKALSQPVQRQSVKH